MLSFGHFPYIGSTIASEGLSFLILSIWFSVFGFFLSHRNRKLLLVLSFLAGLAVANKFTNLFYIFASCALVFSIIRSPIKVIRQSFFNGFFALFGFVMGTWPIKHSYSDNLFKWIFQLATHTGLHGVGESSLFNPSTYIQSATRLFHTELYSVIIVLIALSFLLYKLFSRQLKLTSPLVIFSFTMLVGMLAFAKYPLSHYQLPNYYAIIFVGSVLLGSIKRSWVLYIITPLLIFTATINIQSYYTSLSNSIAGTINFESYLNDHPAKYATVWSFGSVHDFTLLHTRDWMMDDVIYSNALHKLRPDLLILAGSNFSQVQIAWGEYKPIFDVCWDRLYIQQVTLPAFLESHPEKFLHVTILDNTGPRKMALIESSHCLK